jgi:hypothetical protein
MQYTAALLMPKTATTYRLEDEILHALKVIKDRDGIPVSEQVRRALKSWIGSKGITVKSDRKRASTRKRP